MTPLESLRALLDEGFVKPAGKSGPIRPAAPQAVTRTLDILRMACERRHERPPLPGETHALLAFRMGEPVPDFLALKQLCANASKAAGWDTRRLIEDPRLFAALLREVTELDAESAAFVACYRALLASYFAYPALSSEASPVGRNNWLALGGFLRAHLATICAARPDRKWTRCLRENAELIAYPPPERGQTANDEPWATIRRQLGIPAGSGLFASAAA